MAGDPLDGHQIGPVPRVADDRRRLPGSRLTERAVGPTEAVAGFDRAVGTDMDEPVGGQGPEASFAVAHDLLGLADVDRGLVALGATGRPERQTLPTGAHEERAIDVEEHRGAPIPEAHLGPSVQTPGLQRISHPRRGTRLVTVKIGQFLFRVVQHEQPAVGDHQQPAALAHGQARHPGESVSDMSDLTPASRCSR